MGIPNTWLKLSHQFINDDESTAAKAYMDNILLAAADRKFSESFRMKFEDQFQVRDSKIGTIMNFNENLVNLKTTWTFRNKIELTWKNEYLSRYYSSLFYSDYACFTSGILAEFFRPRSLDWQFIQDFRSLRYRNGGNVATAWTTVPQSLSELRANFTLKHGWKLKFLASYDKTFGKSFDIISQEMIWNFGLPLTVTEFSGGFEYQFD